MKKSFIVAFLAAFTLLSCGKDDDGMDTKLSSSEIYLSHNDLNNIGIDISSGIIDFTSSKNYLWSTAADDCVPQELGGCVPIDITVRPHDPNEYLPNPNAFSSKENYKVSFSDFEKFLTDNGYSIAKKESIGKIIYKVSKDYSDTYYVFKYN